GAHGLYGYFLIASNLDQAVVEFRRELEISPADSHAQLMLAWGLLLQKKPSDALQYAKAAAEKSPDNAPAQLTFGRTLAATGSSEEAMLHLERALQLEPMNLEVHIALADAYSRAGKREAAQREHLLCLQMTKDGINRVALP